MMKIFTKKIKRPVGFICLCMFILLNSTIPAFAAGEAAAATTSAPLIRTGISKDAYWYKPGETAHLNLTLINTTENEMKNISMRVKVHASNKNRSDLDASLKGKPVKSYRINQTLKKNETLQPGNNEFTLDLAIPSSWDGSGVYPLTVEILKSDKVESSAITQLIVMSDLNTEKQVPLNFAPVFDISEEPNRDPGGAFVDTTLLRECSSNDNNDGWIATIIDELKKHESFRGGITISPLILEEMEDMSNGFTVKTDKEIKEYKRDSRQVSAVSNTIYNLSALARDPRFQFYAMPYGYPDLEQLGLLGWTGDVTDQIEMGLDVYEEVLKTTIGTEYFVPPLLKLNSKILGELNDDTGKFLLLSSQLLKRNKKGQKLAEGMTLGNPVSINTGESTNDEPDTKKSENSKSESRATAVFSDNRLEDLLVQVSTSSDSHLVAQIILAELTNLFLERPAKLRACAMLWPNWWRPTESVTREVISAISSAPWLQTSTLGECFKAVPPLENVSLEIPETSSEPDKYYSQIRNARKSALNYSKITFRDNPLLPTMLKDLYISESAVWQEFNSRKEGRKFSNYVNTRIKEELAKIVIPETGTITLTSGEGKIPISVVNGTNYKVKTVLRFKSNGLTFPDGRSKKATLEPKENLFEVSVKAEKGGRVPLSASLEGQDVIIDDVTFSVLTSTFNTFAIFVVGGLLSIIVLTWAIKLFAKRRVGKHKKRQLQEPDQEGTEEGS